MRIDNFNRDFITERYVDDLVGNMDFLETKRNLKNCLLQQKYNLSNEDLEIEISRQRPQILDNYYSEETFQEVYYG